jgi:copper chaperone CopZ
MPPIENTIIQQNFLVKGMTCSACLAKVEYLLKSDARITDVEIDLKTGKTTLFSPFALEEPEIRDLLKQYPKYTIQKNLLLQTPKIEGRELPNKSFSTYWPLFLIVTFITGTAVIVQFPFDDFSAMLWMQHFMGGFFIVFSFFKLLNLKGFSNAYAMYDVLAMRWKFYGYLYPFLELSLGILYLTFAAPLFTHWATVVLLGFSSIGVIQSNLKNKKIQCACLGDVFNLPMSTVTIVEDLLMVAMALTMILFHN